MNEDQATIATGREIQHVDARLVARLKQLLHTPGISAKDRNLIDANLRRLLEALERNRRSPQSTNA